MTELIPMTIIDTLSWNKANPPMAKSHPQAMERTMSEMFRTLRNVKSNSAMMSVTAMITERILSDFIWEAFPTAITGPPIMCTSRFFACASARFPHPCSILMSCVLFSVSLAP